MKQRTTILCAPIHPSKTRRDNAELLAHKMSESEKTVQKAVESAYDRASAMSRRMFDSLEKQRV